MIYNHLDIASSRGTPSANQMQIESSWRYVDGLLLLLLEEPVADGCEFIGVVEGTHVFVATAVLVQDGALSEHDEVDVVALGQ